MSATYLAMVRVTMISEKMVKVVEMAEWVSTYNCTLSIRFILEPCHAHAHRNTRTPTNTRALAHTRARTHTRPHKLEKEHTCAHAHCTHLVACAHLRACTHLRARTYTHTHTISLELWSMEHQIRILDSTHVYFHISMQCAREGLIQETIRPITTLLQAALVQ